MDFIIFSSDFARNLRQKGSKTKISSNNKRPSPNILCPVTGFSHLSGQQVLVRASVLEYIHYSPWFSFHSVQEPDHSINVSTIRMCIERSTSDRFTWCEVKRKVLL
jgi:hypothetical protein